MTEEQELAIKFQQTAKQVAERIIATKGREYPDTLTLVGQILEMCHGSSLLAANDGADKLILAVLMHMYDHTANQLNDNRNK